MDCRAFLGFASAVAVAACSTPARADGDKPCTDGNPYDPKVLGADIAFFASKEHDGRVPGSEADSKVQSHIDYRYRCLGLSPGLDDTAYAQPFVDNEKRKTSNLVALIKGTDDSVGSEIIVVGAHRDHLGDGHLGANDNASGLTAMLAIAKAMRQKDKAPKRTIAFVAFGAEEAGMIGSEFYVKHAPKGLPMDKVVQYINLDMVGSYKSKGWVAAMGTFAKQPARKALDKLVKNFPKLHVGVGGRARGSDHLPFCKAGVPYVFFWTPDESCYHETCDTADKIDLKNMAAITTLAGDLVWDMAESSTDLAASRVKLGCGQKY